MRCTVGPALRTITSGMTAEDNGLSTCHSASGGRKPPLYAGCKVPISTSDSRGRTGTRASPEAGCTPYVPLQQKSMAAGEGTAALNDRPASAGGGQERLRPLDGGAEFGQIEAESLHPPAMLLRFS